MLASHTIRNKVPRSPDLEYLLMMFELIPQWTSPRSFFVGLLLPTPAVLNGIRRWSTRQHHLDCDNHSHTDPGPATRLVHRSSRSRSIRRQSFAASATAGTVVATIRELQPIGGRRECSFSKARSFASNRPSLFPGLPRCALQAWLELRPRFLRTTAAATTTAHPSDARGRRHVSWPPLRTVHSVSCVRRDRHVLTLCN